MWPFRRQTPPEPVNLAHCSFCGKSQDEVRKLIAGPTVYICDECIDLCNDIIAEECDQEEALQGTVATASSLTPPRWCRVCRRSKAALELVAVPDIGDVCHPCVDVIRAATDEPESSHTKETLRMRLERILWNDPEPPTERALAARLAADGFESFAWSDPPDADYSPHAHDHDESLWVIEGEITFGAEGKELRLAPGDRLMLPKGTVHTARAGREGARYLIGERRG